VIAPRYDLDPQSVMADTIERVTEQIRKQGLLEVHPLRVYDVGMGTGLFLARLLALAGDNLAPFGLDLSQKMIDSAYQKIPDLQAVVDTAANLDAHFPGKAFDLVCTHFISGFVALDVLAPKVWRRLEEGGYWSYIGATKQSYPRLQAKANSKLLRWLVRAPKLDLDTMIESPRNQQEVFDALERHGFVARQSETFQPRLRFRNLDEFLEFAYYGGWLTPFVEAVGLHRAGFFMRLLMKWFVFPMEDHHCIVIHLAQKVAR
jgi:ubiquinone/menaquinone biosynthesis C-methylase UbiE